MKDEDEVKEQKKENEDLDGGRQAVEPEKVDTLGETRRSYIFPGEG